MSSATSATSDTATKATRGNGQPPFLDYLEKHGKVVGRV